MENRNISISVVVPVYNSEKTIELVVAGIIKAIKEVGYITEYEIVLVDDYSEDSTLTVCKTLCSNNTYIKLVELSRNYGQHNAIIAGFHYCQNEFIVSMDDDMETLPSFLSNLISKLLASNADIVYANYIERKQSAFRRIGTYLNRWMSEVFMGKPRGLIASSYFVTRKFVVDRVIKYEGASVNISGLIYAITNNITTVDIAHGKRLYGKSNYSFKKLFRLWLNGLTGFSINPLRFITAVGFVLSLCSFLLIIVVVTCYVSDFIKVPGWTSLIILFSLYSGIQLVSLGFVGEYVGRTYLNVNKTPQYTVKRTYNVSTDKSVL